MPESLDAPPPRRSATLPAKLLPPRQPSSHSLRSEGILYYHPSAKVVHFSPRALAPIPSSTAPSDFDYPVDTIEALPWRSPTERTVALGLLRLENLHGLTTFLKCGGVVHAILKNSQCWCVDGESTFVLRVRPLTYYRIEIPNGTEEDKESVAELKSTLPNILRYEVTPCPFKRGFTVEIPEESKIPKRKRAWRPKEIRESAPARFTDAPSATAPGGSDCRSVGEVSDGDTAGDSAFTPESSNGAALETIPDNNGPSDSIYVPKETGVQRRSVTETHGFHTLRARFESDKSNTVSPVGDASFSSSVESFHSANPPSPLLPPSSSHSDSTAPTSVECTEQMASEPRPYGSPAQSANVSDVAPSTIETLPELPNGRDGSIATDASSDDPTAMHTPEPSPSEPLDAKTPTTEPANGSTNTSRDISGISAEFRRRNKSSRERDYSPMPPPSILCRPNSDPSEKHDSTSIIQKTCTLVLVPPVQLLLVLIHIAARIVIGSALQSALGNTSKSEQQTYHEALDDVEPPLEDEASTDADKSQALAKPDPWDLD
ncbi:hypothetical protein PHISP_05507 [Aspergillus sp. HF37]|nr:hypothetical protein PHISP_05507 [Aspergillus sp. HF37]